MTRSADLVDALDGLLEPERFQDGQVNGLQVEGKPEIERLAVAVSVNQEVLDAAVAWGADGLLTHHGLLWNAEARHLRGVQRRRAATLLAADMNLITYHLPLDAHPQVGNNASLAAAAGCTAFEPGLGYKGTPIGMVGQLAEPMAVSAWTERFEAALRQGCDVATGPFQVWLFGPDEIRSIGFVSGAAPYQVADAIELGLDAYVTGEVTEPAYHLAKEAGIHFIAGGHYLTERLGVQRLAAWAAERFDLEWRFFDVATEA
ncbi:MAG: Nif3-like dinuclear metal center hexameric protein [Thermoplasmatota archaeon]